ncbi:Homer protein [Dirofilaria immitis]
MEWIENITPLINNRFRHITCVSVQIYKLEGSSWREITKDFVLLHMYYDQEDGEAKLIAIDGIKLIIRGFVLSANLQLIRPTKKFVHFTGSKQRRSEMYGFGFYQVSEVEQFLRLFSFVYRILHLSSKTAVQSRFELNKRNLSISSAKSQSPCPPPSSTASTPKKDATDIPIFFPEDSPLQEEISQTDVNVQHIEKGLQGMSFTSDTFVTTPNLSLIPSLSAQISEDATSSFHSVNSTTFDKQFINPSSEASQSVEQKQYQLWNVPPWNALLEQGIYNNPANFTSPWNSLFN